MSILGAKGHGKGRGGGDDRRVGKSWEYGRIVNAKVCGIYVCNELVLS